MAKTELLAMRIASGQQSFTKAVGELSLETDGRISKGRLPAPRIFYLVSATGPDISALQALARKPGRSIEPNGVGQLKYSLCFWGTEYREDADRLFSFILSWQKVSAWIFAVIQEQDEA